MDLDYGRDSKGFGDGEWIPLSDVEAFDIEEDVYGRDIVTFRYEGRVLRSLIVVDSY